MATIEQRLSALEQQAEVSGNAVFFAVHPDDADIPALGWFFHRDGDRMEVLRLPDETDEALRVRAAAACRAAACPMVLYEIDPDWINHGGLIVGHVMEPEAWNAAAVKQQAALCQEAIHHGK